MELLNKSTDVWEMILIRELGKTVWTKVRVELSLSLGLDLWV